MPDPIDLRLCQSARDFVLTDRVLFTQCTPKKRDEDGPITPEGERAKEPRLVLSVADVGRTKAYAPIRNLELSITLRANAKVPAGQADRFGELCGTLEALLDETNLKEALDAPRYGIRVMLAVRRAGFRFRVEGDLRFQTYTLDVRAVKSEQSSSSSIRCPGEDEDEDEDEDEEMSPPRPRPRSDLIEDE